MSKKTLQELAQDMMIEQNQHLETMAIGITNIADYLGQLLDFISVVNFDELEAREQEMRTAAEKRL